jgi:hypothetical protein
MKKRTMKKKSSFKLPQSEVERIREMVPTIEELRIIDLMRDYRAIRKNYFGSTIPPVEDVLIRFLSRKEICRFVGKDETVGACLVGRYSTNPFPYILAVADDLSVNETRITLLHEMAHMKVDIRHRRARGHGKHWQAEMKRLARIGAFENWW